MLRTRVIPRFSAQRIERSDGCGPIKRLDFSIAV
jgi:hypothetical protein